MKKEEKEDFIAGIYSTKGISDSYPETLTTMTKSKIKLKTEATKGDVVLLVDKVGFENVSSHVGTVTAVNEKTYSFDLMLNGKKKSMKLPYNFLTKKGLVTVGFFTVK